MSDMLIFHYVMCVALLRVYVSELMQIIDSKNDAINFK